MHASVQFSGYTNQNLTGDWELVSTWGGPTGVEQFIPWTWSEMKTILENLWSYGGYYPTQGMPYIIVTTNTALCADYHVTHADMDRMSETPNIETPDGYVYNDYYWIWAQNQHTIYYWKTNTLTTNIQWTGMGFYFKAWLPPTAGDHAETKEETISTLYSAESGVSTGAWHDLFPTATASAELGAYTITFDDGSPIASPACFPTWCDEPEPAWWIEGTGYTGGVSKTKGAVLNEYSDEVYMGRVDWQFFYCTNKFW